MSYFRILSFFFLSSLVSFSFVEKKNIYLLYNSSQPESKKLAFFYAEKREIPLTNLIGLSFSSVSFSHIEYINQVALPLRNHFENSRYKPKLLICFKGVPYKIRPSRKEGFSKQTTDAASLDSELSCLFLLTYPKDGNIFNPLFQNRKRNTFAPLYVGRVDAPKWKTCYKMIEDALFAEENGLSGVAYIDLSQKYPKGDDWLLKIKKECQKDFPTIIDTAREIFPQEYPMSEIAFYYGWYTKNINGSFLRKDALFSRGAIGIHIHSFSASNIHSTQGWAGGLLERGASATLGNVYEPFLNSTSHLDIFHSHLRKGKTLIEAAYLSIPTLSWQQIVLGDPLYRPYKKNPNLSSANAKEKEGLKALRKRKYSLARKKFHEAKALYPNAIDQFRQVLNIADSFLPKMKKEKAIKLFVQISADFEESEEIIPSIFYYMLKISKEK